MDTLSDIVKYYKIKNCTVLTKKTIFVSSFIGEGELPPISDNGTPHSVSIGGKVICIEVKHGGYGTTFYVESHDIKTVKSEIHRLNISTF